MRASQDMRIILATCGFPVSSGRIVGGVAGVTYYLATALSKMPGVELEIVALSNDKSRRERTVSLANGRWTVRTVSPRSGLLFYYDILRMIPKVVARLVDQSSADIVHVQNEAAWAMRIRKPCVLTIHGINEFDTLYRGNRVCARARSAVVGRTEGKARRRVRNVVCINPYVRQFLNSDQRVWEIENPVADSYFDVLRKPKKAVVFCAASVTPLKNIHGLIDAFALVDRHFMDAELRIAGSGVDTTYGQECVERARRLGVASRVHFLGSVSIDKVQQELSQASLIALTSFRETAPLAISEAMAAGVPALASNVCGVPALVEEGVTGRLVPAHDTLQTAETLLKMLTTDNLASMAATAKARAEKRFRASRVAERTLAAYHQILHPPSKGGRGVGNRSQH